MRHLAILSLILAAVQPALAKPQAPYALCVAAIAAAQRGSALPDGLMRAVGTVESGRPGPASVSVVWPWTLNAEGEGHFYPTKEDAVAAVLTLQARGVRSIDVGCMQVNLAQHPAAFATLEQAFDPALNARYAARFLTQLHAQTGSWVLAAAGYHSLTPEIGQAYARRVLALWPQGRGSPGPTLERGAAVITLAGGSTARMIRLAGTSDSAPSSPARVAVQLEPLGGQ